MKTASRQRLCWVLSGLFILAIFMSTGPGVLLVNRSSSILGVPLLYAWAVLWYLVQSGVVVTAYLFLWRPLHSSNESAP